MCCLKISTWVNIENYMRELNKRDFRQVEKNGKVELTVDKKIQTFSTRASSFVSFECPDFLLNFCQLLLDFLAVWSGVEAVVIVIYVTFRFVRLVCKYCYENREQNSLEEVHHAQMFENFVIK